MNVHDAVFTGRLHVVTKLQEFSVMLLLWWNLACAGLERRSTTTPVSVELSCTLQFADLLSYVTLSRLLNCL